MPDQFEKLWLQRSVNRNAQARALEEIQRTGRALPCTVESVYVDGHGSLVTVKFECVSSVYVNGELTQVTLPPLTLPKHESQWYREPTQVGDKGMTQPADTFLGGISGLGSGTADTTVDYGNLSTLVFVPIATTSFPAAPDRNKAWVNGPNGAVLSDSAQTVGISVDHALGIVTIYAGQQVIVLDGDPSINVVAAGGALVGVGDFSKNLDLKKRAAAVADDLKTLSQNIVSQTLTNLCGALGTAAISTLAGGSAFSAIISAADFVTGISSIEPTIPACSATVLLKE